MTTRSKSNKTAIHKAYTAALNNPIKRRSKPLRRKPLAKYPEEGDSSDDSDIDIKINETLFLEQLQLNTELNFSKRHSVLDNNAMALGGTHTVSLRDALEVIPYYDGKNIPFSQFSRGCNEAKGMIPPEAEINLAKIIRTRLLGEPRRAIDDCTFDSVSDLLLGLKKIFANSKSLCQLQGELGNTYQNKSEGVISYATRIKDLGHQILESYKSNSNNNIDSATKKSVEKEMLRCFMNGLLPEIEQRLRKCDNIDETVQEAIDIERRLATISSIRREDSGIINSNNRETYALKTEKCQICSNHGHSAINCNNRYQNSSGNIRNNLGFEIIICQICNRRGHEAAKCRLREQRRIEERPVKYTRENTIRCQMCNNAGHTADQCLRTQRSGNFSSREQPTCQLCHQYGHTADRCRRSQPSPSCQICKRLGHTADKCWQNRPNNSYVPPSTCQICNRNGHTAENCFRRNQTSITSSPPSMCQICNRNGHTAENCFSRNQTPIASSSGLITCTYCGKIGHVVEKCFLKERNEQRKTEQGNGVGPTENGVRRETSQIARPSTSGTQNRG